MDDIVMKPVVKAEISEAMSSEGSLDDFLMKMVNLNSAGVFHDASCAICCHPSRKRAEEIWLKERDAEKVRAIFTATGSSFSIPVIKNHMENHLDQSQVEIRKKEYINKIVNAQKGGGIPTVQRVDLALSAVNERLIAVGAMQDPMESVSKVEKMKSDATVALTKSMKELFNLRAQLLGEMGKDGEVIAFQKHDLERIIAEVIKDFSYSDEAKLVVNSFLEKILSIRQHY
jgi:hypothetical protein